MSIKKVLYRANASATSNSNRQVRIIAGNIELKVTSPKEIEGNEGDTTSPEQLFAAGNSACFLGALQFVAERDKITIPDDVSIECSAGIGAIPNGFGIIEVDLKISLPGLSHEIAEALVAKAHIVCRYSNATRGNNDVHLTII